MTLRSSLITAALIALALGTTACALTPPVLTPPTASPVPTETVAPDPVAASGTRPQARTTAGCADLTNPGQVAPLFTEHVTLVGPTRTAEYIGAAIADEYGIRQAGGVACEWMSEFSQVTSEGRFEYDGIRLQLLPVTSDQWGLYSDAVAGGTGQYLACDESGCQFDRYTSNGWWLSLYAEWTINRTAAESTAVATPVFTAITATIEGLAQPTTPWEAPTPTIAIGSGCDDVITSAQLLAAVGLSGTSDSEALSYPSISSTASSITGASDCRWLEPDHFTDLVSIQLLPGGDWAEQDARQAITDIGAAPPTVAIPGLADPAPLYHHVDFTSIDVNLGGNWIKVGCWEGLTIGGHHADQIVASVAAAIVAAH